MLVNKTLDAFVAKCCLTMRKIIHLRQLVETCSRPFLPARLARNYFTIFAFRLSLPLYSSEHLVGEFLRAFAALRVFAEVTNLCIDTFLNTLRFHLEEYLPWLPQLLLENEYISWCVSSIGDSGIKQEMHLSFSPLLQLGRLFEPFCFASLQHVRTVKRTRTHALPRHEAVIFMDIVHCFRALATPLVASLQPL